MDSLFARQLASSAKERYFSVPRNGGRISDTYIAIPTSGMEGGALKLLAAANNGDVDALYRLGVLYRRGEIVPQNYTKARKFFGEAADKGSLWAMRSLATLYYDGQGGARDINKARALWKAAADIIDAEAPKKGPQLRLRIVAHGANTVTPV